MAYKDMLETFFNFDNPDAVEVHIHPDTIKAIEERGKPNWDKSPIKERLVYDLDIPLGKARYVYVVEIETGVYD